MKKLLPLFFMLIACSAKENTEPVPWPVLHSPESEWITYEGEFPHGTGDTIHVEISLRPGAVGVDSYYKLSQQLSEPNTYAMGSYSAGKYTTLYGSTDDDVVIQLHNNTLLSSIVTGFKAEKFKRDLPTIFQKRELFLKSSTTDELVFLDEDLKPAGDYGGYKLYKRSKLFTVEGYITFQNNTAEFFERNTRENWVVAKLASYPEAREKYGELAKEKFEGIYLKALAYSVNHKTTSGQEVEAIVFKKILKMASGESLKVIE
jgi:hypothetical protein